LVTERQKNSGFKIAASARQSTLWLKDHTERRKSAPRVVIDQFGSVPRCSVEGAFSSVSSVLSVSSVVKQCIRAA
jgi:hypothetical protein